MMIIRGPSTINETQNNNSWALSSLKEGYTLKGFS